ncbi:MAG: hypothetical protein TEF_18235 [Rhizobiales bacterium NRL2]|mgnify:CR=1 FL=1|nr:MAG: hypothetical protein TEF_18235 [Rhizobiales bacterium NRL2]
MLAARDITVVRQNRKLLDGVSLRLNGGSLLAVVGPNGAGKSTLIRCLSGDTSPEGGMAELDGRPIGGYGAADLARRRAVVGQEQHLAFGFSVMEVVLLGRIAHAGRSGRDDDLAAAAAAIGAMGLEALAERDFRTLSGGEKQRCHLARALAQLWPFAGATARGKVLVLDEPTNNLDLRHQYGLMDQVRRMADSGLGVIAVLHDLNLALRYADRVAVLCDGRLAGWGPPTETMTGALLSEVFGLELRRIETPDGPPLIVPAAQLADAM